MLVVTFHVTLPHRAIAARRSSRACSSLSDTRQAPRRPRVSGEAALHAGAKRCSSLQSLHSVSVALGNEGCKRGVIATSRLYSMHVRWVEGPNGMDAV